MNWQQRPENCPHGARKRPCGVFSGGIRGCGTHRQREESPEQLKRKAGGRCCDKPSIRTPLRREYERCTVKALATNTACIRTIAMAKTTKKLEIPVEFTRGWLSRLDGRLSVAKELRERVAAIEADLGGADQLSYATRSLIARVVFIEAHVQRCEALLAEGKVIDIDNWLSLVAALKNLYQAIGLKRQARQVADGRQILQGVAHHDAAA